MNLTQDEVLKKAVQAYKSGQMQEAERLYTAVLQTQPKHPEANHNMGVLAVRVGNARKALPFFETALKAEPKVEKFWLNYIDTLSKLGHFDEARNLLNQARKNGLTGQSFDQLERQISELKAKIQDPPPAQLQSIINLYNQGQLQQALSSVSQMLEKFPNSTTLYNIAGACNAGLMEFEAAIVSYKKALEINPESAEVNNNIGNAFKSLGDLQTAIESFKQAVKIKPDYAEAYFNMGNTLHQMGDLQSAAANYNRAVKVNPGFAEAHYRIGVVHNEQGNFDAAINSYRVAIKLKPDYVEAYIDVGNALSDQGNLQASIDSYKQAIIIKPDRAEPYYNMGLSLYRTGNLDSAIDSYKQALKIKPDLAEAYIDMGNALKDKDDLEAAADSYKQALQIRPDFAEALSNLAQVLKLGHQYEEAKKYFDRLTDKESIGKSLECTYHLRNYCEFKEQLDVIAKKDPTNIRVAAISNFAAYSNKKEDFYPFCEKPIELIKFNHIKSHVADVDKFIDTILREMNSKKASWEPKTKTTKSGFQTSGNLFIETSAAMHTLEDIIRKELDLFYSAFNTRDNVLIKKWPEEYSLQGWYVRMLKNGHQGSHIHPAGWVSGVFYLKTVEAPIQNEGAIQFGVPGDDYPMTKNPPPCRIYQPRNGDLILFPSSLFHRTIPVIKDVERCVIAFDLIVGGQDKKVTKLPH